MEMMLVFDEGGGKSGQAAMELQKSQTKLTTTPSSLLRSPRVRSSIHNLSTVDEESQNKSHKPVFGNNAPNCFFPLAGLAIFFLTLFLLFFFYLREEIPILGSFLIAPVAITAAAFAARKGSVVRRITLVSLSVFRHSWEERNQKPASSPFLSSSSAQAGRGWWSVMGFDGEDK